MGNWISETVKQEVAEKANIALIRNCNGRVKAEDTVMHVGDFCCGGNDRGISGVRTKAEEWLAQLTGKWIMIEGNHDDNNGLKFGILMAVVNIGSYKALVQHRPIERKEEVPDFCDFVICGHVHEKWGERLIDGIWNINVGVDVRRYFPIDDSELLGVYERAKKRGANETVS